MEAKTHRLKTDTEPFAAIFENRKRAEFRKDDRGFEVGDTLVLEQVETNEATGEKELTGQKVIAVITHVQRGPTYGIPEGYAMLSFERARW